MIRCKFKCGYIIEYESSYEYHFTVVYGTPENKVYWESTPSGSLQLSIVKPKGKLFEVGREYLIDISEPANREMTIE